MSYTETEREWLMRDRPGEEQCPAGLKREASSETVLSCQLRAGHPTAHVYVGGRYRWTDNNPGARIHPL